MNRIAIGFDLDGTITQQEILPILAREVDLAEEISVLTEATIKGIIPFEKSFRLRCRLLKDIPVTKVQNIISQIPLDDQIVRLIHHYKENCFVISGNLDIWVKPIIEKLGCGYFLSNAKEENDSLIEISKVLNKANAIKELKSKYDCVVVVGEGMNDVPMFELADIRVAYGGVHPPIPTVTNLSEYVVYDGKGLCRLLNTLL